jgi:hypothetical protein
MTHGSIVVSTLFVFIILQEGSAFSYVEKVGSRVRVHSQNDREGNVIKLVEGLIEVAFDNGEKQKFQTNELQHAILEEDTIRYYHDVEFQVDQIVRWEHEGQGSPKVGKILKLYEDHAATTHELMADVKFNDGSIKSVKINEIHETQEYFRIGQRVGLEDKEKHFKEFGHVVDVIESKDEDAGTMFEIEFDDGTKKVVGSKMLHPATKAHTKESQEAKGKIADEAFADFKIADTNGDGGLSKEELKLYHEEEDENTVAGIHGSLDLNGDGWVTAKEYLAGELAHAEL